jgi:hypothetical protein
VDGRLARADDCRCRRCRGARDGEHVRKPRRAGCARGKRELHGGLRGAGPRRGTGAGRGRAVLGARRGSKRCSSTRSPRRMRRRSRSTARAGSRSSGRCPTRTTTAGRASMSRWLIPVMSAMARSAPWAVLGLGVRLNQAELPAHSPCSTRSRRTRCGSCSPRTQTISSAQRPCWGASSWLISKPPLKKVGPDRHAL